MKIYTFSVSVALLLISSVTASAQYHRYHGRYNGGYYGRSHYYYPSRSSVSIIASLPFGAASITFGNRYYHYYNGVYYRPYNYGYTIVQPPIGIIVPTLPPGYTEVFIGTHPYYRYGNVYYVRYGNRYKVAEEPEEPETAPANNNKADDNTGSGYEKVVVEGKTYYKKGDKYYKASVSKDGEITYEEVGGTIKSN